MKKNIIELNFLIICPVVAQTFCWKASVWPTFPSWVFFTDTFALFSRGGDRYFFLFTVSVLPLLAIWTCVEQVDFKSATSVSVSLEASLLCRFLQTQTSSVVDFWGRANDGDRDKEDGVDVHPPPPSSPPPPLQVQFSPFLGGDCDGKKNTSLLPQIDPSSTPEPPRCANSLIPSSVIIKVFLSSNIR